MYGISAFKNVRIETDRGAHMKAIGIIVQPTASTGICGQPWMHRDFLKRELRYVLYMYTNKKKLGPLIHHV